FDAGFLYNYEISKVPAGKSEDINDLLSREVLRSLPAKPTTKDIVNAIFETRSGRFLAARYGLGRDLIDYIAERFEFKTEDVFEKSREIRAQTDSAQISGGVLAITLIVMTPGYEEMLKKMKLELSDLIGGVLWFNYLNNLLKSIHMPSHTGGMARDLMFGYTPILSRFATNISMQFDARGSINSSIKLHQEIVQQMVDFFSKGGRQNVALIGPEGSGRSTIVVDFAETIVNAANKISADLKFRQIYKLDASALIGAGGGRGQIENLMTHIINEAYNAKNIILWLDNAQLFFEEAVGSVDISNLLTPVIEGGRVRMILTMDQQRFLEISARKSQLTNALNKIMIEPASEEATMKVMQDRAIIFEGQNHVYYTIWALKEAYRLSERYIHDLVMPGRAVNLLEAAAAHAQNGRVDDTSVQRAIEATYGVKLQGTQEKEDRERLLNLEALIHERMIGQEGAVKAVSDALRRSAAGVRNEGRPIGTFLFLGPTGVGKTELAKSIGEVYFKGEQNMVRVDLNEFVEATDVQRLIADGASDEMSLTAQVTKRPFSVVLLDEIEKAHPLVLTTLLQLLDEGVLRDARNHEVSFRDTIIVMTSNAGANEIRKYIDEGLTGAAIKERLTDQLIANGDFKPEFLNRFDEICIFEPLSKEQLEQIVQLIIKSINKTLEPRKIVVSVEPAAIPLLVESGYDPKLGARPMRRIVQQTVENIMAKLVLSGEIDSGANVEITAEMIKEQLA
ncbi:ATP-dependent Clp protease ATP-binding subunit, partial [Candidatus Saccharibacteria bacterium]|nr:ATP-dependent Clp protease ATP-binding subunit [Candidatus Saccharibacteria bacterium]